MRRRIRPVNRVIRYFAIFGFTVIIGTGALIAYCERANSVQVPFPTDTELRASFSRTTAWISRNSDQLLKENNPMLWLFVRDAGRVSGERPLLALAGKYQSRNTDHTLWRFIFDSTGNELLSGLSTYSVAHLPDYNRLFIYGATCNAALREDPEVLALLDSSVCDRGFAGVRSPWCRTHQLMGLRFIQKNHCEPDAAMAESVKRAQNSILAELNWDFRVEDAYIQKVLMLTESGRRKDLKAAWVRRILDTQRADGGWDGVHVIANLPGGRVLAWSGGLYPRLVQRPASTFHATAQALYLLALLLNTDAVG